jgi:hypothetical protein
MMALVPLDAGAVKLTTAVPAVAPRATLTFVGAPGAVPGLDPHAARRRERLAARTIPGSLIEVDPRR